jgi:uncharacterized protein (DUF1015 family)
MAETGADLEPIYLIYDGGGAASMLLRVADARPPLAEAVTPDGLTHRLWSVTDADDLAAAAADLATRRALIADGHHRYATYLERQRRERLAHGPGPWDRGLALLVDSTEYGPQVHAIHRAITGVDLDRAIDMLVGRAHVTQVERTPETALADLPDNGPFAAVLTDGVRSYVVVDAEQTLAHAAQRPDQPTALAALDVTVLHRGLVERVWGLPDTEATVAYAHDIDEAVKIAATGGGVAVLLRPTPVSAVAEVAAAGARMPRKSTLFTPKPASGLVMRRLADQPSEA